MLGLSRRNFWMAAGALLVPVILTGCGSSEPSPDAGSTAVRPSQGGDSATQIMTSRDDLITPDVLVWDSWREKTPNSLEVTFLAGPASCTGIHATVTETAEAVTIDLTQGELPGSTSCRAIALTTTTTVDLKQPLNGRQVRQSAG